MCIRDRYNLDKKQMMPEEGSIQYRNEKNVQPVDEKNKKDILERVLTVSYTHLDVYKSKKH